MKRKSLICSLACVLLAAMTMTACAGAGGNKAAAMTTAAAMNMAPAAVYPEEAYYMEGATAQETAAYDEAGGKGERGLTDTTVTGQTADTSRKLIRTVDLAVETDNFDQLLQTLTQQVQQLGGYVEESNISGNSISYQNEPVPRYASLTLRLPIDKMNGFITTVENSGNVTNKSESAQDVTLQYSDLESRKKSLSVEQDRIWALLEKADTLEAVIALEERLSEIRYELESMESQLRLYDNQVDYSTVHLYINEIKGAATFTPTAPETFGQRIKSGFTRNLNAMLLGLEGFLIWLITCSPFWLPPAVLILAVVAILCRVRKKAAKKGERKTRGLKGEGSGKKGESTEKEGDNPTDNPLGVIEHEENGGTKGQESGPTDDQEKG